jgi:hypothetical protein
VHWIPRGDKRWVDALDRAGSREVGSQMVANSTEVDVRVVEVMERLEPTIGLEPMTCRLRTADNVELRDTQATSDDVTPCIVDPMAPTEGPTTSS